MDERGRLSTLRVTVYLTRYAADWHGDEILTKIMELEDIIRSAETGETQRWPEVRSSDMILQRDLNL